MVLLSSTSLDRVVGLYHQVVTQNTANGEDKVTYALYATVFAKRQDMRGTKRVIAQQTVSQQQIEYTIRYRTDLSAKDQLVDTDGNLAFEIMQQAQVGRREGLSLLCRAIMP